MTCCKYNVTLDFNPPTDAAKIADLGARPTLQVLQAVGVFRPEATAACPATTASTSAILMIL